MSTVESKARFFNCPKRRNYHSKEKPILSFTQLGFLAIFAVAANTNVPMAVTYVVPTIQTEQEIANMLALNANTLEQLSVLTNTANAKANSLRAPLDPVVEEKVKEYFADIPIMIEVARCESRYRHYQANGETLRGVENSLDRGVMQINEWYHIKTAEKMGINILALEGNLEYARYLYVTQGTRPWFSSSPCWGKTPKVEVAQANT